MVIRHTVYICAAGPQPGFTWAAQRWPWRRYHWAQRLTCHSSPFHVKSPLLGHKSVLLAHISVFLLFVLSMTNKHGQRLKTKLG